MARQIGPACRNCRREGIKLFLKGVRCETAKCPMEKDYRNKPPGMHAWRRGKSSDFGVRLREKQKVKRFYGVFEKQFRRLYEMAERGMENTGETLLRLLERRLDNAVFKAGFAPSRKTARQAIAHGHIFVGGRRIDRPGYLVQPADKITVRSSEKSQKFIRTQMGDDNQRQAQSWLQVDPNKMEAVVLTLPGREDVQIPVEEALIVEFCSR
ncbi:MAG: 30S ribosomal protein S4 [Phycisphaerae bacterium]